MERIFNRVGFFVENSIDFEGPPEVVGLRPSPIEGWGLFPPQISLIIDWGGYSGLSSDWLGGHSGDWCLWGDCYLNLGHGLGGYQG